MDEIYFNGNTNDSFSIPTNINCAKKMSNQLFDNPNCLRITKFSRNVRISRI
jgi:hypothetical protein